jgi:predicted O-linked N-acetylglucosamine transferase (SPINDLY family)
LLNGYVTFGSANNARKISDETLNMWGEILNALPTSRLRVKAIQFDVPEARQRVQNKLQEVGVAPNRIDFIGFVPGQRQHLSFYNSIDIALDTTPYNGTTTTCDALLMGVPVIALRGNSHLSRVTFSLLERIGLGELAACERAGYINAAVALAAQSERLSSLRSCLRSMVLQSPLCQYTRFVQNLEQEYARLCGV